LLFLIIARGPDEEFMLKIFTPLSAFEKSKFSMVMVPMPLAWQNVEGEVPPDKIDPPLIVVGDSVSR